MLQTPRGLLALSLVQFGTILLKGQSFLSRYLLVFSVSLNIGKPNISAIGLFIFSFNLLIQITKKCCCKTTHLTIKFIVEMPMVLLLLMVLFPLRLVVPVCADLILPFVPPLSQPLQQPLPHVVFHGVFSLLLLCHIPVLY